MFVTASVKFNDGTIKCNTTTYNNKWLLVAIAHALNEDPAALLRETNLIDNKPISLSKDHPYDRIVISRLLQKKNCDLAIYDGVNYHGKWYVNSQICSGCNNGRQQKINLLFTGSEYLSITEFIPINLFYHPDVVIADFAALFKVLRESEMIETALRMDRAQLYQGKGNYYELPTDLQQRIKDASDSTFDIL